MNLGNIIFAAPDLDFEVARQRYRPDRVDEMIDRMIVYVSTRDQALGLSSILSHSGGRLGSMGAQDAWEFSAILNSEAVHIEAIEVLARKRKQLGLLAHTYWIHNPSVLSDLVLILRDDRLPGAEHGRPLLRTENGFWQLYDGYPLLLQPAVDAAADR